METTQAVTALAALAHQSRLSIFRLLVEAGPEGMAAGAIADALGVPNSSLSFHLGQPTGAGLIRQLPLMRTALVAITSVYMLRGLMIVPLQFQPRATTFDHVSSLIVLGYGLVYLIGTRRAWPSLSRKESLA